MRGHPRLREVTSAGSLRCCIRGRLNRHWMRYERPSWRNNGAPNELARGTPASVDRYSRPMDRNRNLAVCEWLLVVLGNFPGLRKWEGECLSWFRGLYRFRLDCLARIRVWFARSPIMCR